MIEHVHNFARYLVFFQYVGTKYSGVVKGNPHQVGKRGVLDYLEDAIQRLKPINPVSLSISSRTDAGVHALSNSAHFDLQRRDNKPPFTEDVVVEALNFHLKTEQIRITRACRVPDDFHARYRARSRTYVYRLALGTPHYTLLPLTDSEFCWGLSNTELDVDAMREAAALLTGTHDFSTFRAVNSDLPFKNPVKTMDVVAVRPGNSFVQSHFHRELQFLELTFTSRSFLYKQVRRLTGALVAVGQRKLSVPRLKSLLEVRNSLAYPQGMAAPAQGLFLTKVDYKDTDLQLSEEQRPSTKSSKDGCTPVTCTD
ncbi:unnamed protein product [Ophioblennius macclurei]